MRELEKWISGWRATMRAELGAERVEELEEHLREEIDAGLRRGMQEREAFDFAARRLGEPTAVASEFAKARPTMWWPARAAIGVAIITATLMGIVLVRRGGSGYAHQLLMAHVFTITVGYTMTFLLGALGICFVCQRAFGELSPGRMRSLNRVCVWFGFVAAALTLVGVVLGMLWAKEVWNRAWGWDRKELGGAAMLAWLVCISLSAKHELAPTGRLMQAHILGIIVVGTAWFGTTGANMFWPLAILAGGSIAFFLMGLVPAGWLQRGAARK